MNDLPMAISVALVLAILVEAVIWRLWRRRRRTETWVQRRIDHHVIALDDRRARVTFQRTRGGGELLRAWRREG